MTSTSSTEVELACYAQRSEISVVPEPWRLEAVENGNLGFSLPPTDGGKDAWLFLFACFMLEGLIWGM